MEQQSEAGVLGLGTYRYEPRPIRFLGVSSTPGEWHVKRYAITVAGHGGALPETAAEACWQASTDALPAAPTGRGGHGMAVLTMHMGLQGFWALLDWWAHNDIPMHRHWRASADDPAALRDAAADGFGPCVWELAVQAHERRAWLRHVLANPAGPDLRDYLKDGLTGMV